MSADDKTRISPQVANTAVGTQLSGIYELDERIAFGGMGEVYRGHNIQTGDHVAIKIVLPEFARDQTILSLFRKEASILNHLSHDAVVRYHVFTIDPGIGRPYLAMEFVDGESLFDIMRRGPMPTEEVRKLCHRLASGLAAVHQAGAIHRDLSPDNIILPGGRVDRAKIIDFGIARSATVGGETLIGGKFAGKYNYVSPEQLGLYSGDVSEQSDIYSLGLVLAAALRGKPIDMSGSQYEIIEKRRTVPDLSDIDDDFRDIVEAMLQPDPQDRPVSMADIARMTRGEDEATTPPPSRTPRDRPALPPAEQTLAPDPKPQPSNVAGHNVPAATGPGEQGFVPHVRPAHLSKPLPSPAASPPRTAASNVPGKPAKTRTIAIAALATLAVVSVAGLYLSGFMTPVTPTAGKTSLSPEPSKPAPTDKVASAPEPAMTGPAAEPGASVQPTEKQPDAVATQQPLPAKPAEIPSQAKAPKPPAMAVQPQTEASAPPAGNQADAKAVQTAEPAKPIALPQAMEPPTPLATDAQQPSAKASPTPQQNTMVSNSQTAVPAPETTAPAAPAVPAPPAEKVATPPSAKPKVVETPKPEPQISQPEAPKVTVPAPKPSVSQTDTANAEGQNASPPPAKQPDLPVVALNVPKPAIPPVVDDSAQRVSWVRDFGGGDCFYATMTSSTDKAAAIEGFGTAVQPFERMLGDFQAKFHVEPDISVRLIEPSQCEVTNFLRFLGQTTADKPQLVLDRTSVPDGTPISGTLVTHGGLISSVLLIDHKGMMFNLDDRIVAQSDKATFSIPIGLGAADKAAGKAVPQIIMVITGPQDIQAAAFATPTPASVLLPKILEEIETDGSQFSATAKYFRLGG
ncbi:serine/threonine protein kinase [Mesorhizobium sp. M8A.F.Ca.ET.208.01.1.1]|uniref:serine/threonine-protein kinase n=1 Tax=unclassified Mesorhizobium TaxID=325217 RepID=UPI0010939D1F|nr:MULTISPECIES: serine/threonine-protein kinase [unclassified Mesorhizobium]TGQ89239.1 serine/threonine protein kinase [Mesorhizobium sp. M8A.F.Ca.ET.208.01.1.1]TGR32343.1 serine/threonine protein kinase [Mesorhizobium sp. M8A.F.Ca.ET.202.01.1.1]TGT50559.1 serine/threonine protein kinase [Mesorhizobium sp. M8A.F.Ca.ET.167.01.1.1]TGU40221.1 serine/threonine protein kinase [bacterium M00.F.Ca.ET.156.01.1.1]